MSTRLVAALRADIVVQAHDLGRKLDELDGLLRDLSERPPAFAAVIDPVVSSLRSWLKVGRNVHRIACELTGDGPSPESSSNDLEAMIEWWEFVRNTLAIGRNDGVNFDGSLEAFQPSNWHDENASDIPGEYWHFVMAQDANYYAGMDDATGFITQLGLLQAFIENYWVRFRSALASFLGGLGTAAVGGFTIYLCVAFTPATVGGSLVIVPEAWAALIGGLGEMGWGMYQFAVWQSDVAPPPPAPQAGRWPRPVLR